MEINFIKFLQGAENNFLTYIMKFFTFTASVWGFLILSLCVVFFILYKEYCAKKPKLVVKSYVIKLFLFLVCYGVGTGVNSILKVIFNRDRPYVADSAIIDMLHATGQSMPSGHMLSCTIIAVFFIYFFILDSSIKNAFKLNSILWIFIVCCYLSLVALSRIYLGQHYISDIIVGFLLGVMFSFLAFLFYNKVLSKKFNLKK